MTNEEIRLFNRTLVDFALSDGLLAPEVTVNDFDESARALMPCSLSPTPEGVWSWLEMRSIPTNRRNATRICRELAQIHPVDHAQLIEALGEAMHRRVSSDDGTYRLPARN